MQLAKLDLVSRSNNLNVIRLIAAVAVAFGHSFILVDGEVDYIFLQRFPSDAFGFVAVAVFFGLSGFLITQSFVRRKSWFTFLSARWLRIFPGLFFSCFVTAVLVSQFVKFQGFEALSDLKNWRYTFGAFFFDYSYFDGVFDANPNHGVNGSLWTLPIEWRMYLFVFVMGLLGLFKFRVFWVVFTVLVAACCLSDFDFAIDHVFPILFRIRNHHPAYFALPICFLLGMVFFMYREKLVLHLGLACVLLLSNLFVDHWLWLSLTFVYAAFVFGFHPRVYWPRLNFENDLSYGLYVLAFPIQQVLIFHRLTLNPYILFVWTMLIAVPLAFISWKLVEAPALRFKVRSKGI